MMLTPRMRQMLSYIEGYTEEHGLSPSFIEMRDALGLTSISGPHRLVKCLIQRGFLIRTAGRNRSLKVVRPHIARVNLIYDQGFRAGYTAALRGRDASEEKAGAA
jgi:SOS-response transcriptional repressor LexA